MKLVIEQHVHSDRLPSDHPDYEAWRSGVVRALGVTTTVVCQETGRKADSSLYGISCPEDDDSYLNEVKASQLLEVLTEIGFEFE